MALALIWSKKKIVLIHILELKEFYPLSWNSNNIVISYLEPAIRAFIVISFIWIPKILYCLMSRIWSPKSLSFNLSYQEP